MYMFALKSWSNTAWLFYLCIYNINAGYTFISFLWKVLSYILPCDSQMLSSYSVLRKVSPIYSWLLNNADVRAPPVPLPGPHSGKSSYNLESAPSYLQFFIHIFKQPGWFSTVAVTIEKTPYINGPAQFKLLLFKGQL